MGICGTIRILVIVLTILLQFGLSVLSDHTRFLEYVVINRAMHVADAILEVWSDLIINCQDLCLCREKVNLEAGVLWAITEQGI